MRELRPECTTYKVERLMGHGQTSTVFRAIREDSRGHSRQTVALKILNQETAIPWLRREFETLARIQSPHCVRVLAWENLPEGCALVLEWVDGVTLFELGQKYLLSSAVVAEVIAQVQAGLIALHSCGLYHGDLSPSNILIDRSGCVKLVDFGALPSSDGSIRGTPPYIAPEIWEGSDSSAAADLFALGAIEYDLKSGFSATPKDPSDCRLRAMAIATQQGLLAAEASARHMADLQSQPSEKAHLARAVREVVAMREPAINTAVLSKSDFKVLGGEFRDVLIKTICFIGVALLVPTLPVRAQAPQDAISSAKSSLSIRTQKWTEIDLNGRHIGFAPLDIRELQPGQHHILWKTKTSRGELRINLKPGQNIRLLEADLKASP
jgi:serine/threonine protein kinase